MTDIFIKTYPGDFIWLKYCIRSIEKFVTGFRNIIIVTDSGTEFKGIFHKWLYDNNVLQRVAEPKRHQQMANVDNLIQLNPLLTDNLLKAKTLIGVVPECVPVNERTTSTKRFPPL